MFPGRRVATSSWLEQKQVGPNFRPDFPFERGPADGYKCTRLGRVHFQDKFQLQLVFFLHHSRMPTTAVCQEEEKQMFLLSNIRFQVTMTRRKFCSVQNMAENLFSSNQNNSHIFSCQVIINDDFAFQINELTGILYSS